MKPLRSREHPWGFDPTEYAGVLPEILVADELSELRLANRFVRHTLEIITRALREKIAWSFEALASSVV